MELSKETLKEINKCNDINHLMLFINNVLKKDFYWLKLIRDINLLKIIVINNLFNKIELILNLRNISDTIVISEILEGISHNTIVSLYSNDILSEELYLVLIDIKPPSKKRGKFNWKYKKKGKKKAVSQWLTAFAVIILVTQLWFFSLQNYLLLLFLSWMFTFPE